MTTAEAILKSLEDLKKPSTHAEVYENILKNKYYEWDEKKTPKNTISARLGFFIRSGDTRVKRIKNNNTFEYYLSTYEKDIDFENLQESENVAQNKTSNNTYHERDLHALLSTYLKSNGVYSKTIFHEKSTKKDNNQIWTHPDMIGVSFLDFKSDTSKSLMKAINKIDMCKITSYEIKIEIKTDLKLKEYYFQAVSNSSWANYGYLVAFDISDNLIDELQRLNKSFGIGVIELSPNPYESKIICEARFNNLDFITIDKLCSMNNDYKDFINNIERLLQIDSKNYDPIKKQLEDFCDAILENDTAIEKYCKDKNIPFEDFKE